MRRQLIGIAVITALVALAGCTKSPVAAKAKPPAQQGAAQDGPAWTLSFTSTCAEQAVEECVAAFGFAIQADGNYIVGPGPQGQTKTGRISEEELRSLETALAEMGSASLTAETAEACAATETPAGEDKIVLNRLGQEKMIVRKTGTDLCFQAASFDQAQALHNTMKSLAGRYYLTPFPDACLDAVDAIHAVYGEYQSCETAADCVYVSRNIEPIMPESVQFIATDDCELIKPLVVANINTLTAGRDKIIEGLNKAYESCGQRIARQDCTGFTGFESNAGAPVCEANKCVVNPAALSSLR